jgi:hypothetical protein
VEGEDLYKIKQAFAQKIEKELRLLIEEKHLYQSVRLPREDLEPAVREALETIESNATPDAGKIAEALLEASWIATDPSDNRSRLIPSGHNEGPFDSLEFQIVSVRARCGNCGELSPMNLKKTTDAVAGIWDKSGFSTEDDHSVYTFAFQCQSCRTGIEIFAVARKREKFTLVGRSPMERVEVPSFIPRDQRKYYSGAHIAFNSGQVLPALFMLRTFIEQYARAVTNASSDLADEVLEKYMADLPEDFKSRFPSLKKVYGELSDAIHHADESESLFIDSYKKIEKHFDAKRLFDLRTSE